MKIRAAFVPTIALAVAVAAHAQTSQPTPDAANPRTPRGALKALAIALDSGDDARIRDLMNATSPMEHEMVDAMTEMAVSIADLKHAMVNKFGVTAALGAMGDSPDNLQRSLATIDSAAEKVDGDTARVSISPSQKASMTLKKVGEIWKISVAQQVQDQGLTPQQVDDKMTMVTGEARMLKEMTAEVTAGKYATANDTAMALRGKMSGGREPSTAPTTQR